MNLIQINWSLEIWRNPAVTRGTKAEIFSFIWNTITEHNTLLIQIQG